MGVDATTASFGVFISSLRKLVSEVVVDSEVSKTLCWAAEDEEERGDDWVACGLSLA